MKSFKKAFSLVEMLVAVILISLLIGVAIFAFKYQLMAIAKTKKVGINKVLKYNQLKTSIESIRYYVVDDYDTLNQPMKNLHLYFDATKDSLNYITNSPFFYNETSVVHLQCIDNSLKYTEEKLYDKIDFLRPSVLQDSKSVDIYDDLQSCKFSFFKNSQIVDSIKDEIPTKIVFQFQKNDEIQKYIFSIKSDFNISIGLVKDAIYPIQ